MAPTTLERLVEKKRSGIRRLLSPVIFSDDSQKRKECETKFSKLSSSAAAVGGCGTVQKHGGEVRTAVETAFVGTTGFIPAAAAGTRTNSKIRHAGGGHDTATRQLRACTNADECLANQHTRCNISNMTDEERQYCNIIDDSKRENNYYRFVRANKNRNYGSIVLPTKCDNKLASNVFAGDTPAEDAIHRRIEFQGGRARSLSESENNNNYYTFNNSAAFAHNGGRSSAPPIPVPVPYSQYYAQSKQNYYEKVEPVGVGKTQQQSQNGLHSDVKNELRSNNFQRDAVNDGTPKRQQISERDYVIKKRLSPISSSVGKNGALTNECTIIRPQPLYRNTPADVAELPRPKSVSPSSANNKKESAFVRGANLRNTVCGYYPRQSVIYEEEPRKKPPSVLKSIPIFKRGTLSLEVGHVNVITPPSISKKVTFTPIKKSNVSELRYWPTKKGLTSEPPSRHSSPKNFVGFTRNGENSLNRPPGYSYMQNAAQGGYGRLVNRTHPRAPTTTSKMRSGSSLSNCQQQSESESGSEAGEIQKILWNTTSTNIMKEEEWSGDSKVKGHGHAESAGGSRADDEFRKNRSSRREDPRRHTLTGDHHLSSAYHNNNTARSLDLEFPLSRGYPPPSNLMLFDEDPGIMSEVETSSTGFRRGNKQRSSLPVVRTPSKTLERPLGLVFLQYRSETKRSLLPNEITSLDTVKALFVRSFPKQLSMEYLDSPQVKIYIHDSNKDMFYELEDLRSHLNEIRDRSVLRLFESTDVGDGNLSSRISASTQMWNDPDQSYFSEPEFDSEFQHQHIHKTKGTKGNLAHQPYYMTHSFPPGSSATLPRGGSLLRPFSPAIPPSQKTQAGFMSSPERAGVPPRGYSPYSRSVYEDPYYSQFNTRPSSITPIIDEETSDTELLDDGYNLYSGVKLPAAATSRSPAFGLTTATPSVPPFDTTRYELENTRIPSHSKTTLRVEHMERQLANLTGLVQKALTQTVPTPSLRERDINTSVDTTLTRSESKPPRLVKDKSVSFEKSVSFSDDPPEINSPKQHSPQHTERERLKPIPPPKPLTISSVPYDGHTLYRDLQLTPEMYNHLRGLQKKAKDLRQEVRNLRRMSQAQARSVKETVTDAYVKIRSVIQNGGESLWSGGADSERIKINREEDIYKHDIIRLEDDLTELESTVEELRSNVINRKTRVNMSDVENMALILSKSSKTVADLKLKFPLLQSAMKSVMTMEMDRMVIEESFLKEEPERLESALKRCKKLTGTLVTLKRLASVQEQRLPDNRLSPTMDEIPITPTAGKNDGTGSFVGSSNHIGSSEGRSGDDTNYSESTFDSLLEELQTSKSSVSTTGTLRRLHSFPSSDTKPPVPERHVDLSAKRVPPPPPPRTSSKSPLASPTNPNAPVSLTSASSPMRKGSLGSLTKILKDKIDAPSPSTSSSCESINSQEGIQQAQLRQEQLEIRHRELLKKQKALQEQYSRLQQLQKTQPPDLLQLKKTGSESNILAKMGLGLSATVISGSLSHLGPQNVENASNEIPSSDSSTSTSTNTTSSNLAAKTKIYETDIL